MSLVGYDSAFMKICSILVLISFLTMSLFAKAEPLVVGDAAPLVTGITETGASLALGDVYAAQTYTLVYFYPKADTPGCTAQGCSIRDAYEDLLKAGVAIFGVSNDTSAAQTAFKEKVSSAVHAHRGQRENRDRSLWRADDIWFGQASGVSDQGRQNYLGRLQGLDECAGGRCVEGDCRGVIPSTDVGLREVV